MLVYKQMTDMLTVADVKMQVYKQMTDMLKVADVKMQVYKQMTDMLTVKTNDHTEPTKVER